jgi:predicted aspartyl protease
VIRRSIGRAGLALFALLSSAGASAEAACVPKRLASLPADFRANQIRLSVGVDGVPVPFLLDTGADTSTVSLALAKRLGLVMRGVPGHLVGAGGETPGLIVMPREIVLGELTRSFPTLSVMPAGDDGTSTAGLLGMDLLAPLDVEIDPERDLVILFARSRCPEAGISWPGTRLELPILVDAARKIETSVTLDGRSLRAVIDTGSAPTLMSAAVAHGLFGLAPLGAEVPNTTPIIGVSGRQFSTTLRRFDTLEIGPVTLPHPQILIYADSSGYDLILGMNVLGQMHSLFAFGEQKLFFSLAVPHPDREGAGPRPPGP